MIEEADPEKTEEEITPGTRETPGTDLEVEEERGTEKLTSSRERESPEER